MKLKRTFLNCLASSMLLAVSMFAVRAYADVVVIVSASSTMTRITAAQAEKIFLGKMDVFPNGIKAVPIDQPEESPITDEFYIKVTNRNSAQVAAYWTQIIFTGEGFPPRKLNNDVAVKKAVAINPNAIGYIDSSQVDKSVKVILVP